MISSYKDTGPLLHSPSIVISLIFFHLLWNRHFCFVCLVYHPSLHEPET